MTTKIKIIFLGRHWADVTHSRNIGSAEDLVEYVNTNRYLVDNESCFKFSKQFWYNQEAK